MSIRTIAVPASFLFSRLYPRCPSVQRFHLSHLLPKRRAAQHGSKGIWRYPRSGRWHVWEPNNRCRRQCKSAEHIASAKKMSSSEQNGQYVNPDCNHDERWSGYVLYNGNYMEIERYRIIILGICLAEKNGSSCVIDFEGKLRLAISFPIVIISYLYIGLGQPWKRLHDQHEAWISNWLMSMQGN